jgi:hypothetical protein
MEICTAGEEIVMRRMKFGLAVIAATTALMLVSASTLAANPRGRSASVRGLDQALTSYQTGGSGGDDRLTENISLIKEKATEEETPGVEPGGGDPAP